MTQRVLQKAESRGQRAGVGEEDLGQGVQPLSGQMRCDLIRIACGAWPG